MPALVPPTLFFRYHEIQSKDLLSRILREPGADADGLDLAPVFINVVVVVLPPRPRRTSPVAGGGAGGVASLHSWHVGGLRGGRLRRGGAFTVAVTAAGGGSLPPPFLLGNLPNQRLLAGDLGQPGLFRKPLPGTTATSSMSATRTTVLRS